MNNVQYLRELCAPVNRTMQLLFYCQLHLQSVCSCVRNVSDLLFGTA